MSFDQPPARSGVLPSGLVLPKGVRIIDPNALEPEPDALPCSRCGQPMPPLDAETLRYLQAHPGSELAHEVCPNETVVKVDRDFEVRVRFVEITGSAENGDLEAVELAAFSVGGAHPSLEAAMRPLAEKLGQKWLEVEAQAGIADGGV